jgi:hypothetical protein
LFHPGATRGVLPSEVCSRPEPDTSRLALPCLPLATRRSFRSRSSKFSGPASLTLAGALRAASLAAASACFRLPFRRFADLRTVFPHAGIPGLEPRTRALSRGGFQPLAELAPLLAFRSPGVDSVDLGSGFRQPSPHALAVPHGPLLEPQGFDRSSLRQGATSAEAFVLTFCLTLLSFPPSYLDLLLRTWPPAGSLFHLGARSALPPRHPPLCAGSSRPA